MAKKISIALGISFTIIGLMGLLLPHPYASNLNLTKHVIYLISGSFALFFSLNGSEEITRKLSLIFGLIYLGLGILGLGVGIGEEKIWTLLPGTLEWAINNHVFHILMGSIFLTGFIQSREKSLYRPARVRSRITGHLMRKPLLK